MIQRALKTVALSFLVALGACTEPTTTPSQTEIVQFEADPPSLPAGGGNVTLRWEARNVQAFEGKPFCQLQRYRPVEDDPRDVECTGSEVVRIDGETSYRFGALKRGGASNEFVTSTLTVALGGSSVILTVTKNGAGAGTVTSTPAGIACGTTCSAAFGEGEAVTLTATPNAGSTFAGWSGSGCSGTGACIVTADTNAFVTATFSAVAPGNEVLTLAFAGTGDGSVELTPGGGAASTCTSTDAPRCTLEVADSTDVTLSATANAGSIFVGWSGAGCSGTGACAVTVDTAKTVTATFDSLTPPNRAKELRAADGERFDNFGLAVSVSGDTVLVGAQGTDDNGRDSGSAYVFVQSGDSWTQQDELHPDDGASGDLFGVSVALDGVTAVVGAHQDDPSGEDSGSAYVFVRSGGTWAQQDQLLPEDGAMNDLFGRAVSVSGDTAVVGAQGVDDNGDDAGAAYVFVRSGASWVQQDKLLPNDGAANDRFGRSVAISGDTIVVGAWGDSPSGESSGSAYVFVRNGGTWTQQDKLLPDDGAMGDRFGRAVAIDGNTVVVGAYLDDSSGGDSGSAYVFVRSGASWSQQDKLLADEGAQGDRFGFSVSVTGDMAVVGAYQANTSGADAGSAYVFVRSGSTWTQQERLASGSSDEEGANFGIDVDVDAGRFVVGAYLDDDLGAAYVFEEQD